jgi:hypothetical protein
MENQNQRLSDDTMDWIQTGKNDIWCFERKLFHFIYLAS